MLPSKLTWRLVVTIFILCLITLVCLHGWVKTWNGLGAAVPRRIIHSSHAKALHTGTSRVKEEDEKGCRLLPDDITLFGGIKDTSLCCKTCAIISSSGVMLKSNFGNQIDSYDCVMRMNNAPTVKYEGDVGTKTTVRVFSHSSVIDVKNMLRKHEIERNSTVFVVWGPERNMLPGRITYNHLKDIRRLFPGIEIHVFTPKRMQDCDDMFEYMTGKNRLKSGAFLSTGFFTILLARDICGEIDVYGMVEDDYCEKLALKSVRDAKYHYYKGGSATQCATYNLHEYTKRGGHRFLTEKKIFKKWAKEWGNMHFHNPEWELN